MDNTQPQKGFDELSLEFENENPSKSANSNPIVFNLSRQTNWWTPNENCSDIDELIKWQESGHNYMFPALEAKIQANCDRVAQEFVDFNNLHGTTYSNMEIKYIHSLAKQKKLQVSDMIEYVQSCHFCGKKFENWQNQLNFSLFCTTDCLQNIHLKDLTCYRGLNCLLCKGYPSDTFLTRQNSLCNLIEKYTAEQQKDLRGYAFNHGLSLAEAVTYQTHCHNCGKDTDNSFSDIAHQYCSSRCQEYCEIYCYQCFYEDACKICSKL